MRWVFGSIEIQTFRPKPDSECVSRISTRLRPQCIRSSGVLAWLSFPTECRNINEAIEHLAAGYWLGPMVRVGRRSTSTPSYNCNHHFFACDVDSAGLQPTVATPVQSESDIKQFPQSDRNLGFLRHNISCVQFTILFLHSLMCGSYI